MAYNCAGVASFIHARKKIIIVCFGMPDTCDNSKTNGVFIQFLCRSTAPDATAVFPACMFGDKRLPFIGAVWINLSDTGGKASYVFFINLPEAF
jgi:hypothetical protein